MGEAVAVGVDLLPQAEFAFSAESAGVGHRWPSRCEAKCGSGCRDSSQREGAVPRAPQPVVDCAPPKSNQQTKRGPDLESLGLRNCRGRQTQQVVLASARANHLLRSPNSNACALLEISRKAGPRFFASGQFHLIAVDWKDTQKSNRGRAAPSEE